MRPMTAAEITTHEKLQAANLVVQRDRHGVLPVKAQQQTQYQRSLWEATTNGLVGRLVEMRICIQLENAEGSLDSGEINHWADTRFGRLLSQTLDQLEGDDGPAFERKLDQEGMFFVDEADRDRRLYLTQKQWVSFPKTTVKRPELVRSTSPVNPRSLHQVINVT